MHNGKIGLQQTFVRYCRDQKYGSKRHQGKIKLLLETSPHWKFSQIRIFSFIPSCWKFLQITHFRSHQWFSIKGDSLEVLTKI